jgi:hypothetical protein
MEGWRTRIGRLARGFELYKREREAAAESAAANEREAREWIETWRQRSSGDNGVSASNGAGQQETHTSANNVMLAPSGSPPRANIAQVCRMSGVWDTHRYRRGQCWDGERGREGEGGKGRGCRSAESGIGLGANIRAWQNKQNSQTENMSGTVQEGWNWEGEVIGEQESNFTALSGFFS